MNIASLRAELEADRAWREGELAAFHNRGEAIADEAEQKQYRRALVLLLYAHFEGYCKFAFALYASAVNAARITCGDATYAIAAASMSDLFRDLMNADRKPKSPYFRGELPEDGKLRKFARVREFIERSHEFQCQPVAIKDDVVDTESNLTPSVLRKNLYRLGLPHDLFDEYEGEIQKLLKIRNDIAHGAIKDGIAVDRYRDLRNAAAAIMSGLTVAITDALRNGVYLRTPPQPAGAGNEHHA